MNTLLIYVTTPTKELAQQIAEALLTERLIACANIIEGMTSLYRWEGNLEQAQETVLLLKTRAEHFSTIEAKIKELHIYKVPCIVALPVSAGHAPFLNWVASETEC